MLQMKSKTYLTSNIATLYRNVDGRLRYYKIRVYPTLFGEYLLVREWGGINNKKPTGTKQSYFFNLSNLKDNIKKIIVAKSKKGYNGKITKRLLNYE